MSSSDLSVFHGSLHRPCSNSNTASSDSGLHLHYSNCLNPFPDPPIDILQAVSEESNRPSSHLDPNAPTLFSSSSPPIEQLQNLSLAHLQKLPNGSNSLNGFADLSGFELVFDGENAANMMQRSFSGDFFDGDSGFFLQSLLEPDLLDGEMRRTCSAGDLQNAMGTRRRHIGSSEVVPEGGSLMEEATSFRVGRYSAEERRERIHRYRAKRHQRNFNKTIKYACRKTLAENRHRIRGRFARTDAPAGTSNFSCSNGYEDEDEIRAILLP